MEFLSLTLHLENLVREVKSDYTFFIDYLIQVKNAFLNFKSRVGELNDDLFSSSTGNDCSQTKNLLKILTENASEILFLMSLPPAFNGLTRARGQYEFQTNSVITAALCIRERMVRIVAAMMQVLDHSPFTLEMQAEISRLAEDFVREATLGKSLVEDAIQSSITAVNEIRPFVELAMHTLLERCAGHLDELEAQKVPDGVDVLLGSISDELDLVNFLDNYLVPRRAAVLGRPKGRNFVDYFGLGSDLAKGRNLKAKVKRNYRGENDGELKVGDQVDVVYGGYGRIWQVEKSGRLYVIPSDYLL
jgi:hypothetical protein